MKSAIYIILIIMLFLSEQAFPFIEILIKPPPFNHLSMKDLWDVTIISHHQGPSYVDIRCEVVEIWNCMTLRVISNPLKAFFCSKRLKYIFSHKNRIAGYYKQTGEFD